MKLVTKYVSRSRLKHSIKVQEGEFQEKKGAKTLKLVGEVHPAQLVEVIKHEKQNLIKKN